MSSKSGDFCGEAGSFLPTTGMVLWQNIQSGATAKASVVQVGAAGSKGGAGRDEFRSDHFARCQQRNARRICPDILREVRPTACCSANAVCGAKSACAMEQRLGRGWAAPAPRRAGERSAPPQHRSPTGQRQNGQGRFLHRRGRSWPARWHHRTSRFQTASPGAAVPPGRGRSARQQHR